MSHITTYSDPLITDLKLLARAGKSLGLEWINEPTSYAGFQEFHFCPRALKFPEDIYPRIGVYLARGLYQRVTFEYDDWDGRIAEHCGENLGRLKQAYAVLAVTEKAQQLGLRVSQTILPGGTVQLRAVR